VLSATASEVNEQSVRQWVENALARARLSYAQYMRGSIVKAMSTALVAELAAIMRESKKPDERVLDRAFGGNQYAFGLNELLFDVVAFSVGEVQSALRGKALEYVKEPLCVTGRVS
jgi:hypothetical protein